MQQEGRPPPVLDLDEPGSSPSSVPSIQTSADPLTRAKTAGMIVNKCVFKGFRNQNNDAHKYTRDIWTFLGVTLSFSVVSENGLELIFQIY